MAMIPADRPSPPRTPCSHWAGWILPAAALAAALALSQTNLDMRLQPWFWSQQGWLVDATATLPRLLFYDGPKLLLLFIGGLAVAAAWSTRRRDLRREQLYLAVCLALVPTVASNLKTLTDVYCPNQIVEFGGRYRHVPPFQAHPERGRRPGHCFPAGHASGGFALLALAYVDRRRIRRVAGTIVGLGAGATMGVYQMAKGAHFLSHTLTTAALAWLLVAGLAAILGLPRQPGDPSA